LLSAEGKNHILEVKSYVPNVKSNFLNIGSGLRTKKKSTFFFNYLYFVVVGTAESEVTKENPSYEPIFLSCRGLLALKYGECAKKCTEIGFSSIGLDITELQAFIKV
jgi:hypothetical protein